MKEEHVKQENIRPEHREQKADKTQPEGEAAKGHKKGWGIRFALVFLITLLFGVLLFCLWVWVSYRVRFSADFIRAGLTFLYILPCMFGGRVLRALKFPGAPLYGILLGGCVYAAIMGVALVFDGTDASLANVDIVIPAICVTSGFLGALRIRKRTQTQEKQP